jgi:hypothetical protein
MVYLLSLAIGVIAGLRAMTVPAAVSWAAYLGILHVDDTWLSFLNKPWLPWVLTVFALGELVTDQLPTTPSRTVPVQFGARILTGAFAGAAIGVAAGAGSSVRSPAPLVQSSERSSEVLCADGSRLNSDATGLLHSSKTLSPSVARF